eukprot:5121683-Prymnesium_polylepis.3
MQRSAEGLSLRVGSLAPERGEVERLDLDLAVDATRQELAQVINLLRLCTVSQIAAARLIRLDVLHQPLANHQLVELVHHAGDLLHVERTRRVEHEAPDGRALAVN